MEVGVGVHFMNEDHSEAKGELISNSTISCL